MLRLIFASLVLSASAFVANADIDPARVHVVDFRSTTINGGPALIFRGNTPVNDAGTALNYTAWYDTLAATATRDAGVTFTNASDVYIMDICFENEILDYQYKAEVDFWQDPSNSKKGEFIHWMLLGSMNFPPDFTAAQQQEMARNTTLWDVDQLPQRVQSIRAMLLQGPPAGYKQLAIFFHCTHGQDRTGEFANAYRMTFHSTIQDNNKLNGHTAEKKARPLAPRIHAIAAPPALVGSSASSAIVPSDDLTTMGKIYSLGCLEGLRCPMYTFTANAGWYCLWSNQFNSTNYNDCATAYSCIPLLFCSATNV